MSPGDCLILNNTKVVPARFFARRATGARIEGLFLAEAAGGALAAALQPWLIPMRRLLFLRAITWCVKWSVLHRRAGLAAKHDAASTEDWSAENSDPALIDHVAGRVADYLSPATLRRMRGEWQGEPSLEAIIAAG